MQAMSQGVGEDKEHKGSLEGMAGDLEAKHTPSHGSQCERDPTLPVCVRPPAAL